MKKLNIEEAFKNQELEVIQNYIDIGFDFNTIDDTTQSYITVEIMELFDKNGLSFSEKQILRSSDKRIFEKMFAEDRDIFYKIFSKIVYNNWFDLYDWDWDVRRVLEESQFNLYVDFIEWLIRRSSNNQEIILIMTQKFNEIGKTVFSSIWYSKKYGKLNCDEELYTSIITKEKHLLSYSDLEHLIIDGYLELIADVMIAKYPEINPLHILMVDHLKNTLKVTGYDGVTGLLSYKDREIFIRYFESFKYDFDSVYKIQVYQKEWSFKGITGHTFSITPLIFLDKYVVVHSSLIEKALEKSKNIFNNKRFQIVINFQSYDDRVKEFAGNYFEYFKAKSFQDIIFAKLTEDEFNKIKSEISKEELIKLAIKRDDFDIKKFAKWGFSPSDKFIDFLLKEIGDEKTKEYNLINIDNLVKNKDWCVAQLLENNQSIIPKIDKTIIKDVIYDYSKTEGLNAQTINALLKFHINYLLKIKNDGWHWNLKKKEFWDGVIKVVVLNKPIDINFEMLDIIFNYCMKSHPEETKEKFYTLSKSTQIKIKEIGIHYDWMTSEFGKFLVLDDSKYLKKEDIILEGYLENLDFERLQTSLENGFEFQKSYGLFYYIAKLFRSNSDFDIEATTRRDDRIKGARIQVHYKNDANYFDETTAAKIINILLEYGFPNKKLLPTILKGSGQSNIIPSKNDIDYSVMLVGHLIFFRQSTLLELFKKSFKSEYKKVMCQQGFGKSQGNFMHYLIENKINDKKIIVLIKDDVDAMQTDKYNRTWESFAIKTKFKL